LFPAAGQLHFNESNASGFSAAPDVIFATPGSYFRIALKASKEGNT
jgi:hypothetical protein